MLIFFIFHQTSHFSNDNDRFVWLYLCMSQFDTVLNSNVLIAKFPWLLNSIVIP